MIGEYCSCRLRRFCQTEGDSKVYVIPTYTKTNFDKSAQDLRDKRLLTFNSDKLTSVQLAAKGQTVEFGKNSGNDWTIVKPKPMRADGSQIDDLVRQIERRQDGRVRFQTRTPRRPRLHSPALLKIASVTVTDNLRTAELRGTTRIKIRIITLRVQRSRASTRLLRIWAMRWTNR